MLLDTMCTVDEYETSHNTHEHATGVWETMDAFGLTYGHFWSI